MEPRFGKSITSMFAPVSTSQNINTVNSKTARALRKFLSERPAGRGLRGEDCETTRCDRC
jgi:hypothetical protein